MKARAFDNGVESFGRDADLVPGCRLHEFVGGVAMFIQGDEHGAGRQTDASARDEFDIHPFVTGHFENLVPERIAPNAGNERGRNTDLRQMRGHIEWRTARVFTRRQAIPQDLAEGVKLSGHDLAAETQSRPVRK